MIFENKCFILCIDRMACESHATSNGRDVKLNFDFNVSSFKIKSAIKSI